MADVDVDALPERAQRPAEDGSLREWAAPGVRCGAVDAGTVTASGRRDTLDSIGTPKAAAGMARDGLPMPMPAAALASLPVLPVVSAPAAEPAPCLSGEIANHIADLPIDRIRAQYPRGFRAFLRRWPAKATLPIEAAHAVATGKRDGVAMHGSDAAARARTRADAPDCLRRNGDPLSPIAVPGKIREPLGRTTRRDDIDLIVAGSPASKRRLEAQRS
jgi:hypothetical protein